MTQQDIASFKATTKAVVATAADAVYEQLRNSNNRMAAPALVVTCSTADQVAEAIAFVRKHDLTLSVRSGGHGFHGKSTNDGGLVIDLAGLNSVEFIGAENADGRIVRVGAGARWGDVAAILSKQNLALSSGDTKQVGVGGLTLGGGIGWMVRKHGLTIDSLVAAEIVTADGKILRARAGENADLFWAIRGGSGNFGVVTYFEFKTNAEPEVFSFEITFDIDKRRELIEAWTAYMRNASEELSSSLTLFPGIVPVRPQPELRISCCFAGPEARARENFEAIRSLVPAVESEFKRIAYADILAGAPPRNPAFRALNRSGFVPQADKSFAAAVAANAGQPGMPITQIRALGGAMNRVATDATAFAHRNAEALLITVRVAPADLPEAQTSGMLDAMWAPYSKLTEGAYLNFYNDTSEKALREIYPPATLKRLREIKAIYDPKNVFSQTHALI